MTLISNNFHEIAAYRLQAEHLKRELDKCKEENVILKQQLKYMRRQLVAALIKPEYIQLEIHFPDVG